MDKLPKGNSFFSEALRFLKGKPARSSAAAARKSGARLLANTSTRSAAALPTPYRSAEIVCGKNACEGARALSGIRFLAADVPRLPLERCSVSRCMCTYTRHNDRRNTAEERRAQFSVRTQHYPNAIGDERRRKYGRRTGEAGTAEQRYDFSNWDI